MKESIFASEIKKACKFFNCYYYKIPDSFGMQRFSPPKPFDSFILYAKTFFAIEFKMVQKKSAFAFSSVKEHQEENLKKVVNNGGTGLIIVNYRFRDKNNKRVNKSFSIDIKRYLDIKEKFKNKRKSIPYDELNQYAFELKKKKINKKSYWDINSLFVYYSCPSLLRENIDRYNNS